MSLVTVGCSEISKSNVEDEKPEKIIIQAPAAPPTSPLIKLVEDSMLTESVEGGNIEFIIYKRLKKLRQELLEVKQTLPYFLLM